MVWTFTDDGQIRYLNIARISSDSEVEDIRIFNFDATERFKDLILAERGEFSDKQLKLSNLQLIRADFDLETAMMTLMRLEDATRSSILSNIIL